MIKRIILYLFGITFIILGIFFTTSVNLGIGPINTFPIVLSTIFNISFGTAVIIVYLCFIFIQILILKKVNIRIILQLPFSILFGKLVDLCFYLIPFETTSLFSRIVFLIIGTIMLGVGVYFSVNMHLIMNPPDGAVHELSAALKKDFGKMKIIVDVGMVILSSIVSLLFLNKIIGIGIGTVVISLMTGQVASITGKIFDKYI